MNNIPEHKNETDLKRLREKYRSIGRIYVRTYTVHAHLRKYPDYTLRQAAKKLNAAINEATH